MKKELKDILPFAQAISLLLHPYGEVVLHDLQTGCIAALFNNLSKRRVGDESLLEEVEELAQLPDVFPIYFKTNWDGKRMKCISVTIRNKQKHPIGLLCINLDLTKWEEMHHFILNFIQGTTNLNQPEALFKNDWREKINVYVNDYLKKEGLVLKTLSKEQKRELICSLHQEGAFQAKHAAAYIADVLGLSRATIYNYLK